MEIYNLSDKEQIEMIKKWWRENAKVVIISIATALVLSLSWQYWQTTKSQDLATASLIYERILTYTANAQPSAVEFEVTSLLTNHPRTPYASLGALISAQNAIKDNKLTAAIEKFDWVIMHTNSADFKQIAKIRKARVLLAIGKYDDALSLLATKLETYLPLVHEVTGDIFAAKGDKKSALMAYQMALHELKANGPHRSLVQIKYDQLNG